MRLLASLLLVLAACGEPSAVRVTPTDRFAHPASVAATALPGGRSALLVASGNYDLTYDGATGGTVLSVDPASAADGGSAGLAGGALVKRGDGAHVGSFVGELVVADATTCPGFGTAARPPLALVTTRFADEVWRLPLGLDGALGPCQGSACTFDVAPQLHDPFGLTLACRADQGRRSAFVSYLRTADLAGFGAVGWLAELDLDDPTAPARPLAMVDPLAVVSPSGFFGMAYDDRADRLFALGQAVLSAKVFILDLLPCPPGELATCPRPSVSVVDLYPAINGLDLQSIALSNRQPDPDDPSKELPRRAYVSARVYDPSLAALLRARPSTDQDARLLVLDLEEDLTGRPSLRVLSHVGIGKGASQVKVLPVRPKVLGRAVRDVVVVTSATEGVVTVYDDEQGRVVRVIPVDEATGAPEAGRSPLGLVVDPVKQGTAAAPVARVYVAAVQQAMVGILDVPLDAPGQAQALRDAGGALIRIGGLK